MRFISSGILILTLLVSCAQKQDKIQEDSIDFQLDKVIKTYPDDKVQAFEWSEKLVNKYNNAKISSEIAMIHYRKGNYELATYYFKKSSEQFKADGKILQSAEQLTNLGVVYEILGLYPDAVSVYFKALQIFKEKNKLVSVAKIYNNLGIVYQELDKPKESLSYYNKALQLIEKQGNTLQIASKYNNIGVVYEENLKDYDQAFEYYKKANKIYENEKDINNQIITENNIANIFLLKNKAIEAEVIISHILRLNRKKGNDNYLNKIYLNLSKAYFQENKIEKALETGMKSLQLSRDFSDKQTEVNILKLLSEIYEAKNNYKQANQLLKNYYSLKNKIAGESQQLKIAGLNAKYLLTEKENKIKILSLKDKINSKKMFILWLVVIGLILILAAVFMFYQLKQKQNKIEMMRMRMKINEYIMQSNHSAENDKQQKNPVIYNSDQYDLTEKEKEVLLLISKGFTNKEIADKLFVSVNTVKTHTKNIYIKMDVRNRTEAAKKMQKT